MPALRELQADFASAMLSGRSPPGLSRAIVDAGIAAEARLGIYRANVLLSLRRLLEATFPATRRLFGPERFARLADDFVRQAPPERPQLLAFGGDLPAFLIAVDPVIADVARLEWAREEAFHAADVPTLDPARLAAIPPERCAALRLVPHPSLRLVRSEAPLHVLWADEPHDGGAQQVLVTRPDMLVVTRRISPGDAALVEALVGGATLEEAAVTALACEPGFDLQLALAAHLSAGSFAACH